jgi:dipeptidyl aminopeptidase/acylaminoacyl peptidase
VDPDVRRTPRRIALFALVAGQFASGARSETLPEARYAMAERLLSWNLGRLIGKLEVSPNWVRGGSDFWYRNDGVDGSEFVSVRAREGVRAEAFDHAAVSRFLSTALGRPVAPRALPFDTIELDEDDRVRFRVDEASWSCDRAGQDCRSLPLSPTIAPDEAPSPDGRRAVFLRGGNVWVRDLANGAERALTEDAVEDHDYSGRVFLDVITNRLAGRKRPPLVLWSPDSRRLIVEKLDQRRVRKLSLLQHSPALGSPPMLHTYRYPLPGDAHLGEVTLFSIDVDTGNRLPLQVGPLSMDVATPLDEERVWWSRDGRRIYVLRDLRGRKAMALFEVSPETGAARVVIEERADSYVLPNLSRWPPNVRDLDGGARVLWFSERDGYGHLYLVDAGTGETIRPITRGRWVVRDLVDVDEQDRWVYFTGSGREPGENPYQRHLYRASLETDRMELLTPEDADHTIRVSPDGSVFVDTYSRVDLPPVSVLRASDGRLLTELERADVSRLLEGGFRFPERFTVRARDGLTDLYGVLYRPSDFDPSRKYPLIDSIYGGPQALRSATSFRFTPFQELAVAELGFVVMTLDGFGTPYRSRAFRDASYGRLEEAGGLEDHVGAIRQLAEKHPYIDRDRVGIYGGSGGGYATARALLEYPQVFKVGVSYSGNHDQRLYIAEWGERYLGFPDEVDYSRQANSALAERLSGKLLLVHGDMDDNVHPAHTLQLVDALIAANKDFDLLILPNRAHDYRTDPYFNRRLWDYFAEHLLGLDPPAGYRIAPP